MYQVLQNIRTGRLSVGEVPVPQVEAGRVLVANAASAVSAGTEKMVMELSRKSLLTKARERPDHVRRVVRKLRDEGLLSTLRQIRDKLDQPLPMGYSSAGVVLACGAGVQELKPGDRVAASAPHAEVVSVPKNLCARVPDGVSDEQAAFAVLGTIAMQGVRLAQLSLGETAFVIGLGLIGQITVAMLKAAGVRVVGTDLVASKCELARKMGADVARPHLKAADVEMLTGGLGADAVLVTAATKSDGPIELAAGAVRRKGRVVAVGAIGLNLPRRPFYFKEAEFVVPCSFGPGRYDRDYEEGGRDYPAGYVRWTEQRNMQAVLDLMAAGKLDVGPLISHRFSIADATSAYELLKERSQPYLGIVLKYPQRNRRVKAPPVELRPARRHSGRISVGCLGAGNFARTTLLPAIGKTATLRPEIICSARGVSAAHAGQRYGFASATADEQAVFQDSAVDAVFVLTQHDHHARQVIAGIRAGKHVFVEKPLCLTVEELAEIEEELCCRQGPDGLLMVGFNRRFSPAARAVRRVFAGSPTPLTVSVRFNPGALEPGHWTQNEAVGGGRIIGEACHGIDLATFLVGAPPVRVFAEAIGGPNAPQVSDDQCFITLRHADGSVSNIGYLAGGDKAYSKERIEVIGANRVAVIDDFRLANTCSRGRRKTLWRGRQDKGHRAELVAFSDAITQGGPVPISWEELRATTLASMLAVRSLREGVPLEVPQVARDTDIRPWAA